LFQTHTALIYDAVTLFAHALYDFDKSQYVNYVSSVNCESKTRWSYGPALMDSIKMVIDSMENQ